MTKKSIKIILITIMLLSTITLFVLNLTSIESQASRAGKGPGTRIINSDGTVDCQGAILNC